MNLNVITQSDAEALAAAVKDTSRSPQEVASQTVEGPAVTQDDLYSQVMKYIPGPLLGIYLFAMNIVLSAASDDAKRWAALGVFVVAAILIVLFLRIQRKVYRVLQIGVSLLAFAAFAFSSAGPAEIFGWYRAWYGSLALAAVAGLLIAIKPPNLSAEDLTKLKP